MSYSPEVYTKISALYTEKRRRAINGLEERRTQARRTVPGLAELDDVLLSTGVRIMEAIRKNDGGRAFDEVKKETDLLAKRRGELLEAHGFPRDYLDPHFDCPLCGDTGYANGRRCVCMKKALYEAQAALSGLGSLLGSQTFENFSLAYYPDKTAAREVLDFCKEFAASGVEAGRNMLLLGTTGLGKTHLSTAIADTVMKNGGSVIYESAPNILADFRYEQFCRGYNDNSPVRTDKYFGADLTVIDDLGSEMPGPFAASVLYNLINTRLNNKKSLLINTNLTMRELAGRYDNRIASRLLGQFKTFTLTGSDIRMLKRKQE